MWEFLAGLIPDVLISGLGCTRRGAFILASVLGVLTAVFVIAGFVYIVHALH